MRTRHNGNGATLRLNEDDRGIENRTGGAQPRAEQRPVRGRLMLSMMSGVFGCLSLGQTADGENTEYQRN
ncbi:MAG: hypothetical protein L0H94_13000 [Nitrospira sp.]|nr:hypothetical protein [Nitrospira sp.]